jgi:hypothetical protein
MTNQNKKKPVSKAAKIPQTAKAIKAKQSVPDNKILYTLEVFIRSGPLQPEFVKKNRVISRTMQIRADQTLADLHDAIFYAFDREDEHMYEFQIGGKGPMDPKARRYVIGDVMEDREQKPAGGVENSAIGSLGLKIDESFGYWFDFGDDWWHQIDVIAIEEIAGRGKFPKVIKRVGKSPPQYPDWDDDDDDDD